MSTAEGDPWSLPGLVARRLAHDLAGPIAALSTLLDLRGADPLEAQALGRITARLSLFRALLAEDPDQPCDADAAIAALRSELGPNGRLEAAIAAGAPPRAIRGALALAADLARMTGEAGEIELAVGADGQVRLQAAPLYRGLGPGWPARPEAGAAPDQLGALVAVRLIGPARVESEGALVRLCVPAG